MAITLKEVFDEAGKDLVVDNRLAQRIARYRSSFVSKNEEHIAFFGGNLLGVQVVRHTPSDRAILFEDVLGMDEQYLSDRVLDTELIEPEYNRVSDPYNSAALYLLHRLMTSTKMSPKVKEQAMIDTVFMLQAKLLTSILSHWFQHPANPEEAKATYAQLSLKFDLKVHGSWNAWLINRAETFLLPTAIHYASIQRFAPDKAILYAITEPQDRLREVVKSMYAVYMEVRRTGSRIRSTSSTLEMDGELAVRTKEVNAKLYLAYSQNVLSDKATFIRDEAFTLVKESVSSVSPDLLRKMLVYVSDNYNRRHGMPIEPMVQELVLHAIDYIAQNKLFLRRTDDLGILVTRLKHLYQASRLKDQGLIKARDAAEKLVDKARLTKNPAQQASLRTALQLYVVVRVITMNYYK